MTGLLSISNPLISRPNLMSSRGRAYRLAGAGLCAGMLVLAGCSAEFDVEPEPNFKQSNALDTPGFYYALPKTEVLVSVPATRKITTRGWLAAGLNWANAVCRGTGIDRRNPLGLEALSGYPIKDAQSKTVASKPKAGAAILSTAAIPDPNLVYRLDVSADLFSSFSHEFTLKESGIISGSDSTVTNVGPEVFAQTLQAVTSIARTVAFPASAVAGGRADVMTAGPRSNQPPGGAVTFGSCDHIARLSQASAGLAQRLSQDQTLTSLIASLRRAVAQPLGNVEESTLQAAIAWHETAIRDRRAAVTTAFSGSRLIPVSFPVEDNGTISGWTTELVDPIAQITQATATRVETRSFVLAAKAVPEDFKPYDQPGRIALETVVCDNGVPLESPSCRPPEGLVFTIYSVQEKDGVSRRGGVNPVDFEPLVTSLRLSVRPVEDIELSTRSCDSGACEPDSSNTGFRYRVPRLADIVLSRTEKSGQNDVRYGLASLRRPIAQFSPIAALPARVSGSEGSVDLTYSEVGGVTKATIGAKPVSSDFFATVLNEANSLLEARQAARAAEKAAEEAAEATAAGAALKALEDENAILEQQKRRLLLQQEIRSLEAAEPSPDP